MFSRTFVRHYAAGPKVSATLLLLRTPVITADLPEFQKTYYKYQKELWKRLMWTFPKWFYYRPGTISEQKYRELNKNPVYNNPNVEFVGGRPEIRQQRDRRFKQEVKLPKTYDELSTETTDGDSLSRKIVPNSRITKADEANDLTSLERKLSRTLYLLVSSDGKKWSFPTFSGEGPLHQIAEDGLFAAGGEQINYFNVSKKPFHVHTAGDEKQFFIKSHILSGEFKGNEKHMWLTREEAAEYLDKTYFEEIEHLMSLV